MQLSTATAAACLLIAGCAEPPQQVPIAPPPPVFVAGECDAQAAQVPPGRPYTAQVGEQAKAASRAERMRVLRPGDMVTMEFDARRLSIDLDAEGRVVRVRCG
jgi:hypothetical protein